MLEKRSQFHEMITSRRSFRVMSGEEVTLQEFEKLMDAARWAPSEWNDQPWRFIYARSGKENWDKLFSFIVPANQKWAAKASILVVVLAKNILSYKGRPGTSYRSDAGAACQNAALVASEMGLAFCCIGGFENDKAVEGLEIPDEYVITTMIAIGRPRGGKIPKIPGIRKSVKEISSEGSFDKSWNIEPGKGWISGK